MNEDLLRMINYLLCPLHTRTRCINCENTFSGTNSWEYSVFLNLKTATVAGHLAVTSHCIDGGKYW